MNKKIFALGILLIAALCTVQASYWTRNPQWKKILWAPAEVWYEVPAKWTIVAADKYINGYIGEAIKQAKPEIAPKQNPDVLEPLKFLREREIVHFQRFGEGLRLVQDRLNSKNFYAFNPAFD